MTTSNRSDDVFANPLRDATVTQIERAIADALQAVTGTPHKIRLDRLIFETESFQTVATMRLTVTSAPREPE